MADKPAEPLVRRHVGGRVIGVDWAGGLQSVVMGRMHGKAESNMGVAIVSRCSAVLSLLAIFAPLAAADDPSPQEIADLVGQLDSDDFETREKAVPQLIVLGKPVIAAVGRAALEGSSETRFRAVTILAALSRENDIETSEAAHQALLKVAGGNDLAASQQADEALGPFKLLDKMRQLAEAFAVFEVQEGKPAARLPLSPRHVQRFVDKQRLVTDGTLWTMGGSGRPKVVLEVYPVAYQPGQEQWYSAITSLTTRPLKAEKVDGVETQDWAPLSWGQEFAVIPKAAAPEGDEQQRSATMQQIARRFSAHQFWQPGVTRYDLEVLPQPVLRYKDEAAGILDGGLFVIAHETNPEVLLLIEAQANKNVARWMYALAPLGSAAMHVSLDEEEVWTCPTPAPVGGGGTHPYWAFARKLPETK